MIEAVLIKSVIDTYEERKVAIVNVPRDFLKADKYETINMTLRGKLSEIMVKAALEVYIAYVIIEEGEMVLYVQLLKAL